MDKFVLDCDNLAGKIDEFTTLSNQMQNLSTYIESFPTNNDEFNFGKAINTISANIVACSKKINNTAVLISNVIENHTNLQNTLIFNADDYNEEKKQAVTVTSRSSSTSNVSNTKSSVGNRVSYSGGSSTGVVASTVAAKSVAGSSSNSSSSTTSSSSSVNKYEITIDGVTGTAIDIPEGLGSVHTYMGWQMITARGSNQYKLREAVGMNFDEEGFGKIGDRYVIACTTTYGNVGDCVDFIQEDGTVIKCVIGDIKSQSYTPWDHNPANKWGHNNGKCIVEFVVDKTTWYNCNHPNPGNKTCHPEWNKNIVKSINYGNYEQYLSKEMSKETINNE